MGRDQPVVDLGADGRLGVPAEGLQQFGYEMIGLVLSRRLLADEFKAQASGGQTLTAYFLLDDYASWLSQPESRIADILALNVEEREEDVRVVISIVESKYIAAEGLAKARRDSKDQLLATLGMFREALFGDPGRLDRDVWLARLADMLIDADIPPGMTGLMERARSKLRAWPSPGCARAC